MPLDPAYNKAIEDTRNLNPYVAANRAGVDFDGREFRIPFFDRVFVVRFPEIEIHEIGSDKPASMRMQITVLHYLITASGAPIADEWITFRQLPGGAMYEPAFAQRAIAPLVQAFGSDLEGFVRAAESMGGVKMDRTGDAAYYFMAFPRLRIGCVLYVADEEMPASINFLFDKAAASYLATEDLSGIGGYLSAMLVRKRGEGLNVEGRG